MECKLYKETDNVYIYAVNKAFYLVIPKNRFNPSIEIILDNDIKEKLNEYVDTNNIGIIRVFAKNYFEDVDDEISRYKLKSIINTDISVVRQILDSNHIEYNDTVIITTPFEDFKKWYINENTRQDTYKRIKENNSPYNYSFKEDNLSESQRRINELIELKNAYLVPKEGQNFSKDKTKKLSNGHNILNYNFDDGFINVVFLSLVTIIVSISSILFMLNALIK